MVITEKLKQNNLKCCGCTACYAVCPQNAITMQADSEGFKYPVIDKEMLFDVYRFFSWNSIFNYK